MANPFYIEYAKLFYSNPLPFVNKTEVQHVFESTFGGNGTLNDANTTVVGKAIYTLDPDGLVSINGRANITSPDDNNLQAYYIFKGIGKIGNNGILSDNGVAVFITNQNSTVSTDKDEDDNDISSFDNTFAIYADEIHKNGYGVTIFWSWK